MLVLGLSDLDHDTAAALVGAEGPIAAIEEEKLSRTPAAGVPQMAIDRCLAEAKAKISSLSMIGVACRPKRAWLRDEGGQWNALARRAR